MHHLVLDISCAPPCRVSKYNLASFWHPYVVSVASVLLSAMLIRQLSWLQSPGLYKEMHISVRSLLSAAPGLVHFLVWGLSSYCLDAE